jgi:aspartate aminotransferase
MFLVKRSLDSFIASHPDRPVYDASQGDGGASLPGVPHELLLRAAEIQVKHGTAYDQPTGSPIFRNAIIEEYWKLDPGLGYGPENIAAVVGGRDGMTKAFQAILALGFGRSGDAVLVSRVPWVSYTWGIFGIGGNALLAPGDETDGWTITPEAVEESVQFAQRSGREVAGLVITSPDNPTGRWLDPLAQVRLAKAALRAGVAYVLFDWIYHYITDHGPIDLNVFLGHFDPSERARLIVLDGLTKSLGGSNIRGAHLVAAREVIQLINAQASHTVIPAFYPQAVTLAALEIGFAKAVEPIVAPTNRSRQVLRDFLSRNGFRFIMDQGYYAFIDAGRWLDLQGWTDTESLGRFLAEEYGVAVVPGVHFSVYGSRWIRFSYATEPAYTAAAAERMKEGLDSLT